MTQRAKKIVFWTLLACLLLLTTIVLFEFVGQVFLFPNKLYFVNDVDHRMKPHNGSDINSDGIRSRVESDQFRKEDLNIIFLGDSFIYGHRLSDGDAIPQQFEREARALHPDQRIHVANFGWVTSSPLLSYRLLKDIGGKYNPDVVILGIDMTDVHDDIMYRLLLERKGIYRALPLLPITIVSASRVLARIRALDPLYEDIFGIPAQQFFITESPLSRTRPYFSDIRNNIDAINRYCRNELHAKFILIILPRGYQYSANESPHNWEGYAYRPLGPYSLEPFKYFESLSAEVDYPIHSLLTDFQHTKVFPTCFDDDPHWNPDGARIAAQSIYRYCLQDGCFQGLAR